MRRLLVLLSLWGCDAAAPGLEVPSPADHQTLLPNAACARCHPRQAEAYAPSAMNHAAFSPVFNAMDVAFAEVGGDPFVAGAPGAGDNLCAGCHAPVAALRGLGSDGRRPVREALRDATTDGISCDYCHRITAITGEANAALEASPGVVKFGPILDPVPNGFHESQGAPRFTEGALCGACHDVRFPRADVVAGTADARIEDLFSEWRQSPWADAEHPRNPLRGQPGIEGLPFDREAGEVVTCQDCHMSLYPARGFADAVPLAAFAGVDRSALGRKAHKLYAAGPAADVDGAPIRRLSTHAFAAASNPLVPFPLPEVPYEEALIPLPPEAYGPDPDPALAARRAAAEAHSRTGVEPGCDGATDADGRPGCALQRRAEMLRAAATLDLSATATEGSLIVDAWVENVGAGHNVPAGFSQEREVWIEMIALDMGRACVADADCADLIEPRLFVDDPPAHCAVRGPDGALDPVLRDDGTSWDLRMRKERSGRCDPERLRCVLRRSGYLIDRDGDGRVADEDLRGTLTELDPAAFTEACVLPGPDADMRPLGLDRGLVIFTNEFQRVALDADGAPAVEPGAERFLVPDAEPVIPSRADPPVLDQRPAARRSPYATQRALYERHRYQSGARSGHPPAVLNPLEANRFFNGNALRPFEPRLARYAIDLPAATVGPLLVTARLRFRFFPPKLLRLLAAREAARGTHLVDEGMIDRALVIVDMASDAVTVELR